MGDDQSRLVIPILSVANFVIGMGAFMVIGLLGPVAQGLNLTPAAAGWMMTVYALAYAVLSPLLVAATGRIGRRRVLAIGLGLFALANLVAALSTSAAMLFFARVIAAAGAGMFTPIAAAVAAGLSAPEARGRALAAVFFGLTLAQVLGVPAGSWLAYTFGWRVAFFVVLALAVPCVWLIWTFIPSGLSFQAVSLRDLGRTLRNGPIMLAVMITASFLSGIYVVYTYMSPLLSGTMGFGRDGITAALLVFGCGAVIGNLVGGRVSDRIGPIRTLTILASLQVMCLPVFSFLPLPPVAVFAFFGVWSSFGWSFMAGQQTRLIGMAPETASVVLALNAAAIYVGAAFGSAVGGIVLDQFGLMALGWTGGVVALLALLNIRLSYRISGH